MSELRQRVELALKELPAVLRVGVLGRQDLQSDTLATGLVVNLEDLGVPSPAQRPNHPIPASDEATFSHAISDTPP